MQIEKRLAELGIELWPVGAPGGTYVHAVQTGNLLFLAGKGPSGPDGSMAAFAGLDANKTYIHINNTNPIWRPDSRQRAEVLAAGWQIARDGQETST